MWALVRAVIEKFQLYVQIFDNSNDNNDKSDNNNGNSYNNNKAEK